MCCMYVCVYVYLYSVCVCVCGVCVCVCVRYKKKNAPFSNINIMAHTYMHALRTHTAYIAHARTRAGRAYVRLCINR